MLILWNAKWRELFCLFRLMTFKENTIRGIVFLKGIEQQDSPRISLVFFPDPKYKIGIEDLL